MTDVSQDWLERNFPCKWACPVHTEAGTKMVKPKSEKMASASFDWRRMAPW